MSKSVTGIIDLKINNIKSVLNASNLFSETYIINESKDFKKKTDNLILPGNGFFKEGVEKLKSKKLFSLIQNLADKEIKIIGICLGMQLLMDKSEESLNIKGLGIVKGDVNLIDNKKFKVPLLGWYETKFKEGIYRNSNLYFNNKFICNPKNKNIIHGYINNDLTAYFNDKNIYGLQFHPEKSSQQGLKILEKIIK